MSQNFKKTTLYIFSFAITLVIVSGIMGCSSQDQNISLSPAEIIPQGQDISPAPTQDQDISPTRNENSPQKGETNLGLLEPESGTYFGVNLDWDVDTPKSFNDRLGKKAAVFVNFYSFPFQENERTLLDISCNAVANQGGMLMVTLEPWGGLETVTVETASDLANSVSKCNDQGVSVFIRFAHEMNGSWYIWSQQPEAYVKAFRIIAETIHQETSTNAMLWAPNYGGGYPFVDGQYQAKADSAEFSILDTNNDGVLDMKDDPYLPYYPGDDAVDWVGMSIYHWGNSYPWGENENPEAGKFLEELTGNYSGLNGDESAVPNFYELFFIERHKPIAIPETAAFYDPAASGPVELTLKQLWWRQVFDPALFEAYPGIKMINWFEHAKNEIEVGNNLVDWRVLGTEKIAKQFIVDLPLDRLLFAP